MGATEKENPLVERTEENKEANEVVSLVRKNRLRKIGELVPLSQSTPLKWQAREKDIEISHGPLLLPGLLETWAVLGPASPSGVEASSPALVEEIESSH